MASAAFVPMVYLLRNLDTGGLLRAYASLEGAQAACEPDAQPQPAHWIRARDREGWSIWSGALDSPVESLRIEEREVER